jgi:3-methyladenine DNA glycosylase/8-oxoguanine DNA glycosylase
MDNALNIYALDLINRQRAEIERLKEAYAVYEEISGLKRAKAEAIKEFAERVIDLIYEADDVNTLTQWQIRDLVKELTEGKQ